MRVRVLLICIAVVCIVCVVCVAGLLPLRLTKAARYREEAYARARENGLDGALVLAVINAESSFDPLARSGVDARGLMQMLPSTAQWVCEQQGLDYEEERLYEASYNMTLAVWYLAYLCAQFDLPYAVCAYNAGEGKVREWLAQGIAYDQVPYDETRAYVKKVLAYRKGYAAIWK